MSHPTYGTRAMTFAPNWGISWCARLAAACAASIRRGYAALYNHFRDLMIEAQAKTDKSYELIAKKKATIKRLEKQIEKLEKNIYYYPSWVK